MRSLATVGVNVESIHWHTTNGEVIFNMVCGISDTLHDILIRMQLPSFLGQRQSVLSSFIIAQWAIYRRSDCFLLLYDPEVTISTAILHIF